MGPWTINLLRRVEPEKRLHAAAWIFWVSIVLGVTSVVLLAQGGYEKVLLAISWGAVTLTAVDVILTADVRVDDEDD